MFTKKRGISHVRTTCAVNSVVLHPFALIQTPESVSKVQCQALGKQAG